MKIAIDCREVLNPEAGIVSGIPEYIDGLTRVLLRSDIQNEWFLFFRADYPREAAAEILALNKKSQAIFLPYQRGNFWINHWQATTAIRSIRPDVTLFPAGQVPLGWRGRSVVTAHDLAIYDHPEWFPDRGFGRWLSTKFIVPHGFRRADKIIAVSEATKKDLVRIFKIKPEKIFVVYPAVTVPEVSESSVELVREKFQLPQKYFLCLGTIEPRKNFSLAVRATKILSDQGADVCLAIAGKRGWKWQETLEEINKANVDKKIISELGYISQEEKLALLAGAEALIFPSLHEGFGLPVLEAMTLGVPVITTQVGALPEVGGLAVYFVPDNNPTELVETMSEITIGVTREKMIVTGEEQAKKFDWGKAAEKVFTILSENK
ncbi:MAG: glycosyltransferase family 1 protein [Candidatus Uhrbacteria bacterium]